MKQKHKELLLKDLCARLPYKTIVQIDNCGIWDLRGIDHDDSSELRDRVIVWHGKNYPSSKNSFPIINCKPYLFPLSSMTKEQKEELKNLGWNFDNFEIHNVNECLGTYREFITYLDCFILIDWLNKHHFDYRGLILMGLAIDATELNIY